MSDIIELEELLEKIEFAEKRILDIQKDKDSLKREITELFNKVDNSETLLNSIKSKSSKLENFEDLAKRILEDKDQIRKIGSEYLLKLDEQRKHLKSVFQIQKDEIIQERKRNLKSIFLVSGLCLVSILGLTAFNFYSTNTVKKRDMEQMLNTINSNFERMNNKIESIEK